MDTTHATAVWATPYAIPDTWFSRTAAARPFSIYIVIKQGGVWVVFVNYLFSGFGETK